MLTEQNSLLVLGGFDPVLLSWKPEFLLSSTLSPLFPLSFCPLSLLKDEIFCLLRTPMLLTLTMKILGPLVGYLFPASRQHMQSQLSCTANLLGCANTRFCKEMHFFQKLSETGRISWEWASHSFHSVRRCDPPVLFVHSVHVQRSGRFLRGVPFFLPESQTVV